MPNTRLGWHFLRDDRTLGYKDNRVANDGETLTYDGADPPKCCKRGMHASEHVYQALAYAPGLVLCRVEISGHIDSQDDKFTGRQRRILWSIQITKDDVVEYANWCAKRAEEYTEAASAAGLVAAWVDACVVVATAWAARAADWAADWAARASEAAERAEQQRWWEKRVEEIRGANA